jgi:hypothetical protein
VTGDNPVYGIWLGHALDELTVVVVGSLAADLVAAEFETTEVATQVAFQGALMLTELAGPPSTERAPEFDSTLVAHLIQAAGECRFWPTVAWLVDGQPRQARQWRFGGGCVAMTRVEDTYLVVISNTELPPHCALTRVLDGRPYGIDLRESLSGQGETSVRGRPEEILSRLRAERGWHPDYDALRSRG